MAVTKRTRYEVLRRDGNACRYCGQMAPEVKLTIDHVMPKSLGGSDDPPNLVAACMDCNAGKASSNPDSALMAEVSDDALRYAAALQAAADEMVNTYRVQSEEEQAFYDAWMCWTNTRDATFPLPADWSASVREWLRIGLPLEVLDAAIPIAMHSAAPFDSKFRYFAGICRNKAEALTARAKEIFESEPEPEPLPVIERDPSEPQKVTFDPYKMCERFRVQALPGKVLESFIDGQPIPDRLKWAS